MTEFSNGDRVRAPNPDSGDEVEGTFLEVADPDQALEIAFESGVRKTDAAWIRLDDGSTLKVVYHRMRPAYWEQSGTE
jgi:hypothetical protein